VSVTASALATHAVYSVHRVLRKLSKKGKGALVAPFLLLYYLSIPDRCNPAPDTSHDRR